MSAVDDLKAHRRQRARALALKQLEEMTDEEDRAITEDALRDPDNPPLQDDECLVRSEPPVWLVADTAFAVRLDSDVVDRLKATGPGWEERVNVILRKALEAV